MHFQTVFLGVSLFEEADLLQLLQLFDGVLVDGNGA